MSNVHLKPNVKTLQFCLNSLRNEDIESNGVNQYFPLHVPGYGRSENVDLLINVRKVPRLLCHLNSMANPLSLNLIYPQRSASTVQLYHIFLVLTMYIRVKERGPSFRVSRYVKARNERRTKTICGG